MLFGATGFTGAPDRGVPRPARAPTGCAGAWRAAASTSSSACGPGWPSIDAGLADLPLLVADSDDVGRPRGPRCAHPRRDLDRRPLRRSRRGAGRRLRRGRHRLLRHHRRGRVRRQDVRRSPRHRGRLWCAAGARAAASTRSPTTWARCSPSSSCPDDVPITVRGVVRAGGVPSGGTFDSALTGMSRVRQIRDAARARREVEPRPEDRSSRAVAGKPHHDSTLGLWLLPLPTIDPAVVARSGAALASYGPSFRYSHYAGTKTLRVRRRRRRRPGRPRPGRPGEAAARAADEPAAGRAGAGRVAPRASRGSPSTSSARAAARRCTPGSPGATPATARPRRCWPSRRCAWPSTTTRRPSGQVTTAQAMGANLLSRVQAGGLTFEVL